MSIETVAIKLTIEGDSLVVRLLEYTNQGTNNLCEDSISLVDLAIAMNKTTEYLWAKKVEELATELGVPPSRLEKDDLALIGWSKKSP